MTSQIGRFSAWPSSSVTSRRRSPSVKNPLSLPVSSIRIDRAAAPLDRADLRAAPRRRSADPTPAAGFRPCGTSSPRCTLISFRPNCPAGWNIAKSSAVNFRSFITVSASASPSASIAVVEALGASPSGQASSIFPIASTTSARRPEPARCAWP